MLKELKEKNNGDKMALKDWKEGAFAGGRGWHKNGNPEEGFVFIGNRFDNKNNKYSVEIYKRFFGGVSERPDTKKFFTSESQALSFARNYMRTH